MRAKKITLVALPLTAGLSLTACQGDEDSAASGNGCEASPSSSADTSSHRMRR